MAPNDTTGNDEPTQGLTAETTDAAAAVLAAAEGAGEAATAPVARKRTTRRTTKKAAAVPSLPAAPGGPEAAEQIETAKGSAEVTAAEAGRQSDVEAPAAKRPRKRATAATRAVAPRKRASRRGDASDRLAATEPGTSAEAPVVEAPVVEALVETPSPESRRRRKSSRTAKPEPAPAEAAADHEAAPADDLADTTPAPATEEPPTEASAIEEAELPVIPVVPSFSVLFQAPDISAAQPARRRRRATSEQMTPAPTESNVEEEPAEEPSEPTEAAETTAHGEEESPRRRRRRGGKGRRGRGADEGDLETEPSDVEDEAEAESVDDEVEEAGEGEGTSRRRRRRRRAGSSTEGTGAAEESPGVSTRVREPRAGRDEPVGVKGSTRLEAKKQRRREGREAGRRRTVITEAEFLARRESVDRIMVVRNKDGRTQMGVLEDGVLVEHYIDQATNVSMAGNIYLGRVQNVLPSMEAAFVDIGKGRNAVLYAGEVNWDAAGLEANQPKRIENALTSGQTVLVQVTKDPIGHKGARLTSQISLPGRYLVYVPNSSMTGISRKLPDTERARLKKILRDVVPDSAGVIVRTAAEGASEAELRADVERLARTWEEIQATAEAATDGKAGRSKGRKKNGGAGSSPVGTAPMLLHGEPDLTVRVIRDVFNEDFKQLIVSGEQAWDEVHGYIIAVAPDLADRVTKWTGTEDLFSHHRVDEQLAKAMDRKVWLPSGGSLVIDRTEAMTVVDVNTGKFVGSGGNLEETVTKNNLEAAEEIVRQLRLRDIGGIIVIDFIDMVLESNRELVVRRLLECLGRDRTKHQVAEVTSLGLVQMTRKRVGSGLIEVFGETCDHCNGRGFIIHSEPVTKGASSPEPAPAMGPARGRRGRRAESAPTTAVAEAPAEPPKHSGPTAAQIAAAAHAAALKSAIALTPEGGLEGGQEVQPQDLPVEVVTEVESEEQGSPSEGPSAAGLPGDAATPVAVDARADATMASPEAEAPGMTDEPQAVESEPEPSVAASPVAASPVAQSEAAEPEAAEPEAAEPEAAPAVTAQPEPTERPRRRRGRVVAPAGPPPRVSSSEAGVVDAAIPLGAEPDGQPSFAPGGTPEGS